MRKFLFTISFLFFLFALSFAQPTEKHAPPGYDSLRTAIPHGKIDTIRYPSTTVGVDRRALIYTPPGYYRKNKYPVL